MISQSIVELVISMLFGKLIDTFNKRTTLMIILNVLLLAGLFSVIIIPEGNMTYWSLVPVLITSIAYTAAIILFQVCVLVLVEPAKLGTVYSILYLATIFVEEIVQSLFGVIHTNTNSWIIATWLLIGITICPVALSIVLKILNGKWSGKLDLNKPFLSSS